MLLGGALEGQSCLLQEVVQHSTCREEVSLTVVAIEGSYAEMPTAAILR